MPRRIRTRIHTGPCHAAATFHAGHAVEVFEIQSPVTSLEPQLLKRSTTSSKAYSRTDLIEAALERDKNKDFRKREFQDLFSFVLEVDHYSVVSTNRPRGGENPLTTGVKQAVPYRAGREAKYLSVSTE
jgi:hypothetical protein